MVTSASAEEMSGGGAGPDKHMNGLRLEGASLRVMSSKEKSMNDWEPKITAFFCNWCTYGAADLAGVSRLQYPPNIRVIRVPCSGRISPKFLLSAFRHGADGVWVSG